MVLKCGAIKYAVMLIIYFAGKGLKVGRGATLARAALPDQITVAVGHASKHFVATPLEGTLEGTLKATPLQGTL